MSESTKPSTCKHIQLSPFGNFLNKHCRLQEGHVGRHSYK